MCGRHSFPQEYPAGVQLLAHSGLSQTSLNGGASSAPGGGGGGDIHSILANMQRTSAGGAPVPRQPAAVTAPANCEPCVRLCFQEELLIMFTNRASFWAVPQSSSLSFCTLSVCAA